MLILNDFKCDDCGHQAESLEKPTVKSIGCFKCKGRMKKIFSKSTPVNIESFNPHYDFQMGQWFESRSHKKRFLEQTGRAQISGHSSPRKTGPSNIICNRRQAAEKFGIVPVKKPNLSGVRDTY